MRIAMLTEVFPPRIDGVTNRLGHTLRRLREAGHEVLVVAPDTAVPRYEGFEVVRVPSLPTPGPPGVRLAAPDPRVLGALRRFQPDVVHALGPVALGVWGLAAARLLALPIVVSCHTDLARAASVHGLGFARGWIWKLVQTVHAQAHVNLAPSRWMQDELRRHGVANVGLWRGAVDGERFHPRHRTEEMRMRLSGGWPDAPVVLYAGRLSAERNLDQLRLVLDAAPDAQVAVVGDGPLRAELARTLPAERVTFTGFLEGRALACAFASADLFFLPSTTETLGSVALEAMASGVPVVAAAAGGLTDLVRHAENGWLFPPERTEEALRGVRELLGSLSGRRFYAAQARKAAEAHTWTAATETLLDHYRRAMAIAGQCGPLARLHRALASRVAGA
jgi:glycosyltransferase involved in cell wall biosynthesis